MPFNGTETEFVFIELTVTNRQFIAGVIYRPPNNDPTSFIEALASVLDIINKEKKTCFLLGDFNLNLLTPDHRIHSG